MRTLLFLTVFLCSLISFGQKKSSPFIKDRPLPAHAVNDFAKLLTKKQKDQLEKQVIAYRNRTGYDIVIITLPTLTDTKTNNLYSSQDVTRLYFDKWAIDDSLKDKRVLLLCVLNEIRIRSDTTMGALLTNTDCHRIFNEVMIPAFDKSQYFTMFKEGVTAITGTIDAAVQAKKEEEAAAINKPQEPQPVTSPNYAKDKDLTVGQAVVAWIVCGIIIYWLISRIRRKRAFSDSIDDNMNSDEDAWLTKEGTTTRRNVVDVD